MGEQDVEQVLDEHQQRGFMKALPDDLRALERMLEGGQIESGVRRIGAEQEMFLVGSDLGPAPVAEEVLARVHDARLVAEIARFDLEANLTPHLLAGVAVAVSGALSGVFVVFANAWMNSPTGFELVDGRPANNDPIAAMLKPMAFSQTMHMTIAAYAATGFVVAGVHAYLLLRDRSNLFHRRALAIALAVGGGLTPYGRGFIVRGS